ncbi:hypothetical protein FQN50_004497 [Emmonsiellopsis sp. PD_5]|nr:hypothetical protein FQN50_004497 [Emmonsiellopsis sp. PD_5]
MRYYSPGDDIYFFGFSRGAYTARFLAEMLDFIGLLSIGNEELVQFAWETFAKWQQRGDDSEEDITERLKLFSFMKAFRETFSRPVERIRFLGLFDTAKNLGKSLALIVCVLVWSSYFGFKSKTNVGKAAAVEEN